MKKILAVSSSGGHWVQLKRIATSLPYEVTYVCTDKSQMYNISGSFFSIPDFNKKNFLGLFYAFIKALYIFAYVKPDVVITTGAAPGLIFIYVARFFRKKTIWVDSIANAEEPSLSGKRAIHVADLTLTQSQEVSAKYDMHYFGEVL